MSLYWPDDEAAVDLTGPRLHALVVAVGDYPYLSGPKATAEGRRYGLRPLTTTIHTGRRIAEWLTAGLAPGLPAFKVPDLTGYRNPDCPLGSVEVVQSPYPPPDPPDGPSELVRPDGKKVAVGPATMAGIEAAFATWFKRCHARKDNTALFYFTGHGISTTAQFLLASDFQHPNVLNPWKNCVDFTGLRREMLRRCQAQTQLFFVDACREPLFDVTLQIDPKGESLVGGAKWTDPLPASSGTYHAAAEGLKAYGPADGPTYFATALLDALEGAGARWDGQRQLWRVTTSSLSSALDALTVRLAEVHDEPALTSSATPEGRAAAIHYPSRGYVHVKVGCKPPQVDRAFALQMTRHPTVVQSPNHEPRPWRGTVHPGDWQIRLTFDAAPPRDLPVRPLIDTVEVVLEDPV